MAEWSAGPALEVIDRGFEYFPGELAGVGVAAALGIGEAHRPGAATGQGVIVHALVVGSIRLGLGVGAGAGVGFHVLEAAPLAVGAVLGHHQLVIVVMPRRALVGVGGVGPPGAARRVGHRHGRDVPFVEPVRAGCRGELLPVHREARGRVLRRIGGRRARGHARVRELVVHADHRPGLGGDRGDPEPVQRQVVGRVDPVTHLHGAEADAGQFDRAAAGGRCQTRYG